MFNLLRASTSFPAYYCSIQYILLKKVYVSVGFWLGKGRAFSAPVEEEEEEEAEQAVPINHLLFPDREM